MVLIVCVCLYLQHPSAICAILLEAANWCIAAIQMPINKRTCRIETERMRLWRRPNAFASLQELIEIGRCVVRWNCKLICKMCANLSSSSSSQARQSSLKLMRLYNGTIDHNDKAICIVSLFVSSLTPTKPDLNRHKRSWTKK